MSASVLPRDPVAGSCSATGIGNVKYRAPSSFHAAAFLTARVDGGTPNWIISAGDGPGGPPLAFGAGRNVTLGPIYMDPGERLNIAVNGADPNAKILGQWVGFQADTVEELVAAVATLPGSFNSRNVVDINPVVRISANSASGQNVVSVADVTPFHVDQAVDVNQSGLTSTTAVVLAVTPNDPTGADPSGTLTLNINLKANYTNAGWVMVLAIVGAFGQPIYSAAAGSSAPGGNLAVLGIPADIEHSLAPGTSAVLVSGVAGKTIYVFGCVLAPDAASTSGFRISRAGAAIVTSSNAGGNATPVNYAGSPIDQGSSLSVTNPNGSAGSVRGGVSYAGPS